MLDTDGRLFGKLFTIEEAQKIEADPILAERLDAFVSRFGRLQDTVGDKLLPALLTALAEKTGPAIDNLDKAEKFGFIESADGWMEMRRLRNQMVHEPKFLSYPVAAMSDCSAAEGIRAGWK